jgi:hypothetical protein
MTETKVKSDSVDFIDLIHTLVSEGQIEEATELYANVKDSLDLSNSVFIEY